MTGDNASTGLRVLDLFAGPGGWDEGLKLLGISDVVGLEWDEWACLTAHAAGHLRVQSDVSQYPPSAFSGVDGVIASPPCPSFSSAGRGAGREVMDDLLAHVHTCADGWVDPPGPICAEDVRADLTLQPLRWVDELRPRWVALEQVPDALPIWVAIAHVLRQWGYSAWAGTLNAADYGVPQTRKRAFLIARKDGFAGPPEATHSKNPEPTLLGQLSPWITMADALGWGYEDRGSPTVTGGGASTGGPEPFGNAARKKLQGYVLNRRTNSKDGRGGMVPTVPVPTSRPAPTVTGKAGGQWVFERPATTVCADPRIPEPGWRGNPEDYADGSPTRSGDNAIRCEPWELAVLQGFPADYPFQGNKGQRCTQIGNAVPPPLAAAVLKQFAETREVAA